MNDEENLIRIKREIQQQIPSFVKESKIGHVYDAGQDAYKILLTLRLGPGAGKWYTLDGVVWAEDIHRPDAARRITQWFWMSLLWYLR